MIRRAVITVLLGLAITTLMTGVLSYWVFMAKQWERTGRSYLILCIAHDGVLAVVVNTLATPGTSDIEKSLLGYVYCWYQGVDKMTFRANDGSLRTMGYTRTTGFRAPWWVLFLLFSFYPGVAFAQWHRCRRIRPGCCRKCGYNLTGLPEPRCPECGQPFESKGDAP